MGPPTSQMWNMWDIIASFRNTKKFRLETLSLPCYKVWDFRDLLKIHFMIGGPGSAERRYTGGTRPCQITHRMLCGHQVSSCRFVLISGRFEKYNIARNQIGFYTNVGMTARYEIDRELMADIENSIFGAVTQLVNSHPVMALSILDESSHSPSWTRLQKIDLRQVVKFANDVQNSDISAAIESEHQKPFKDLETLPLWRLMVFSLCGRNSGTIIVGFFFHHGICDGLSGVAFHIDFLKALRSPGLLDQKYPTIIDVPKLSLLPALEEMHQLPLSIYFIATQILKSILPAAKDDLCWTGRPIHPEPHTTSQRSLFLPFEIVDNISRLCRNHGVTITALLTVIIARVLAGIFPDYERFTNTTAMSFRRFTDTPPNAMVLSVSSFGHRFSKTRGNDYLECGGEFNWETVKACGKEIQTATSSPKNSQVGLLSFLNDYGGWLKGRVGQKRDHSFELSNVGAMDGGLEGPKPRIKSLLFSQSRNVTGGALNFSVASVKGGDMGIALTWQESVVATETAERVLADLEAELRDVGER